MRRRFGRLIRFVLLPALLAGLLAPGSRPAQAARPDTGAVLVEFADLIGFLLGATPKELGGRDRAQLVLTAKRAKILYIAGDVCGSANTLGTFLKKAKAARVRRPGTSGSARAESIFARAQALQYDVVASSPPGRTCAGFERVGREPAATLGQSDNTKLAAIFEFGKARLNSVEESGESWTQVQIPGIDAGPGQPGQPGVPLFQQLVAVPIGAQASLTNGPTVMGEELTLNLYPFQGQALDAPSPETFADPPFVKDEKAYLADTFLPRSPCALVPIGTFRELRLARVSCAVGQYNPTTDILRLFERVSFDISFKGGSGFFLTGRSASPFESDMSLYTSAVLNSAAVGRFIDQTLIRFVCIGSELLVLSPPALLDAANTLADWKRTKGITTNVKVVADGAGSGPDTNTQIDAYIEGQFTKCITPLSYVLLLGDAELVPTFYRNTSGSSTTGTDYPYALFGSEDDLAPDFAVGRIPVDTLAQANTVVAKIVTYEQTPPTDPLFYSHATMISQFQCCRSGSPSGRDQRSFVETTELGRNVLTAEGKFVDRIYTKTGAGTPARYFDGTGLPAALTSAAGFGWTGDAADISAAFNAGRFLIVHRDHGGEDGFVNPEWETPQANALTNGALLPVLFSVNCASGLFDNETAGGDYGTAAGTTYFGEALLRKSDGGVVGMLGDTRNSPTWANSALLRGFFDAVWPSTLGGFGDASVHRRLGDILNFGKLYLQTQTGVAGTTEAPTAFDVLSELYMWHVIGDPTLELWRARPQPMLTAVAISHVKTGIQVRYAEEGATITALQKVFDEQGMLIEERPVGRAMVRGGQAFLKYFVHPEPKRSNLVFSASKLDFVSTQLSEGMGVPKKPRLPKLLPRPRVPVGGRH